MSPALLPAPWHPWITWFEAKSATNSWKSRHHEIGEGSFISWTYLESRPSGRHLLGLAHELAAVDLDDLAYQVVGPRRGQEQHRACYLLRCPLADVGPLTRPWKESTRERNCAVRKGK
jgi:hypothetical protein